MAAKRFVIDYIQIVFVAGLMVLMLLGYARLYSVTNDLQRQQNRTCALRHAGRASENAQVRRPLKEAFRYLGDIGTASAAKQSTKAQRDASLAFAAKFKAYAARVDLLINPECP